MTNNCNNFAIIDYKLLLVINNEYFSALQRKKFENRLNFNKWQVFKFLELFTVFHRDTPDRFSTSNFDSVSQAFEVEFEKTPVVELKYS